MNINLSGRHALVTGSSRGIGYAIAFAFAQAGANVTLLARNESALQDAKATLPCSDNQTHHLLVADSSDVEQLQQTVANHVAQHPVDILVNNSGGPKPGPAHLASSQEYLSAFNQHLLANHTLSQIVIPAMREKQQGRIVNIISTSVKQPITGLGVSNTIRGAVASWAKTLSNELGVDNITVNNILPGATSTERLEQIFQNKATKAGKTVEEIAEHERGLIPLGRFAKPEEIANAALFLASDHAGYITGVSIPVDGGRTLCL